jgi:DNA-binding transcriptional LysR family regulator
VSEIGRADEFDDDARGQRNEHLLLALMLGDSVSNLLQDGLDLAIRFGVPQNSSMVAYPLASGHRP